MQHFKQLAQSIFLLLFSILLISAGLIVLNGISKTHAALFPTKLVSIYPLTQSGTTHNVGDPFIIEAVVTAQIWDNGALSLIMFDSSATEIGRSCINVQPAIGDTKVAFLTDDSFSIVQEGTGNTTYTLSAEFHKNISCENVSTHSSNKKSMSYAINWQSLPLPTCHAVAGTADNDKAVILLRGLTTSAASLEDNMSYWTQMAGSLSDDYENLVYFSYDRSNPFAYTVYDTYVSVPNVSTPLLKDLLLSCKQTLGADTSIDVVGHSQGGIVSFEFMRNYATQAEYAGLIEHLVMMDSPINGTQLTQLSDYIAALIELLNIDDPDDYVAALRGDASKRMEYMSKNYDNIYQDNLDLIENLGNAGTPIHAITNANDSFATFVDTFIDGCAKFDVGPNDLISIFTTNHRILKDRFAEYPELVQYFDAVMNEDPDADEYLISCDESVPGSGATFYKDYGCRATEGTVSYGTNGWYFFDSEFSYDVSSANIAPGYSMKLINIDGSTQCLTGYVSDLNSVTYPIWNSSADNNATSVQLYANGTCSIF